MIDLVLAGKRTEAQARAASAAPELQAPFPELTLTDLDGRTIRPEALSGRAVLVELWATWCPPCRGTLSRLAELKQRHGDRLVVLAIAVESDEADVRKLASKVGPSLAWIAGTPDTIRAFGDVSAVPTALLFGPRGEPAGAYYGTPPGLHEELAARLDALLQDAPAP